MPEGLQRDLQAIEEAEDIVDEAIHIEVDSQYEDIVDEAIHIEVDSQYEDRACAGPFLREYEPPIQRATVTGRGFSHRPMEVRQASPTNDEECEVVSNPRFYSTRYSGTWSNNTISFSYDDCVKEEQPKFKQMIFKCSKEE